MRGDRRQLGRKQTDTLHKLNLSCSADQESETISTSSQMQGKRGKQLFQRGCWNHKAIVHSSRRYDLSNPLTVILLHPPSPCSPIPGWFAAEAVRKQKASLARLHPLQGQADTGEHQLPSSFCPQIIQRHPTGARHLWTGAGVARASLRCTSLCTSSPARRGSFATENREAPSEMRHCIHTIDFGGGGQENVIFGRLPTAKPAATVKQIDPY